MAKTLSEYIADTRRITRVNATVPFNDSDVTKFINEAKDYISSIVPFALVYSYYSSVVGKSRYFLPKDILVVLSCKIYPYAGSYLKVSLAETNTEVTVDDVSSFPDSGFVYIGDPPTWEIIKYTGKNTTNNKLTGCSRGQYGTKPKNWVYDQQSYTPVRGWERNAKWIIIEPQTDVSVFIDSEWEQTPQDLQSAKSAPTTYGIRSGALVFDKPFHVNGFANIMLTALITPPDLVNPTDTVYGMPDAHERIIPVCAGMLLLKALGGEEALTRFQTLSDEFSTLLSRLAVYVEKFVHGVYGSVAVDIHRTPSKSR